MVVLEPIVRFDRCTVSGLAVIGLRMIGSPQDWSSQDWSSQEWSSPQLRVGLSYLHTKVLSELVLA